MMNWQNNNTLINIIYKKNIIQPADNIRRHSF